jgi:uncharacterized membrane protein YhaH (DUF805 family)
MIQTTPSLSFSQAVNSAANNIFNYKGRARRSEFWWTMLLVTAASFFLTPLVNILTIPLRFRRLHDTGRSGWWWATGFFLQCAFMVSLFIDLLLTLAVSGDSGLVETQVTAMLVKNVILLVIAATYQLILIVFYCFDSNVGENKYGPSPKYVDDGADAAAEPEATSLQGAATAETEQGRSLRPGSKS